MWASLAEIIENSQNQVEYRVKPCTNIPYSVSSELKSGSEISKAHLKNVQ